MPDKQHTITMSGPIEDTDLYKMGYTQGLQKLLNWIIYGGEADDFGSCLNGEYSLFRHTSVRDKIWELQKQADDQYETGF